MTMASTISRLLSEQDLARISAAIGSAEAGTSGEVVPYMVEQSDDYDEAELRGALLGAVAPALALVLLRRLTEMWLPFDALEATMLLLAGMAAGWSAAAFIPSVKRLLAGSRLMERRTAARAAEAFLAEEVFATKDRSGILLFISLLEHRVMVRGDSGITAHVRQEEWRDIVECVTRGLRSGRIADGLVEGLELCGTLLRRAGVARRSDDANELPDRLRTEQ